ncbi:MAG TPA: sulfite oxidase [Thermoplasmata archaeon]|nr:sulfite oxidase [Thermoplasmata archaeon]
MESPLSSLETPITPTSQFFIRSHFATPSIDLENWRLSVDGHVEHPLHLTRAQLLAMEHRRVPALLECAGNSRALVRPRAEGVLWRNGAVGTAEWGGVPLAHVLELAGARAGAVEVVFEGLDRGHEPGVDGELGFAMSITMAKARDPDTLLADEMNGRPLGASHGFPLRSVVPDWYGMASVKWLSHIRVVDRPFTGFYRSRAYAFIPEGDPAETPKTPVTVVRVKSIVTWPREGQQLPVGTHRIRGAAWSGAGRILRVEVSTGGDHGATDPRSWHLASLSADAGPHSWVHWEFEWTVERPGFYVIRARASDASGNIQPVLSEWNFRGVASNSLHEVPVEVLPA